MRTRTLPTAFLLTLASAQLAAASTLSNPITPSPGRPSASLTGPISNERTTTYWAYSTHVAPVRIAAAGQARRFSFTHLWTEDGFPEVYLVLARKVYPHETWLEIRLPGRPNGRTGWVRRPALGALRVTHKHLVIDRRRRRLILYVWGRKLFSAPVGVGAPESPTPAGNFWIRERFRVNPPDPAYGTYAFGTADYATLSDWPRGGVVGIHGTDEPSLIPGDPSHGCVRMKDADDVRLWRLLPVGTPVTIT